MIIEDVPRRRNSREDKSESGFLLSSRAEDIARRALEELGEGEVGSHLGVETNGENVVTHRFAADIPGYPDWEWNAVLAHAPGTEDITVNEVALVAGPSSLTAPEWVPYSDRIRPGDLGPQDELPPRDDDPRLTGLDSSAAYLGQASTKKLTPFAVEQTKKRWREGEYGPNSEFAENSTLQCRTCAFFVPLQEPIGPNFGACTNEFSADEHVVSSSFGCGAHSATPPVELLGINRAEPFDDEQTIEIFRS